MTHDEALGRYDPLRKTLRGELIRERSPPELLRFKERFPLCSVLLSSTLFIFLDVKCFVVIYSRIYFRISIDSQDQTLPFSRNKFRVLNFT